MIEVSNLVKRFAGSRDAHHVRAVNGVSFSVPQGKFFTLLGPSGCGKTTTLRCVAGLERPTGGTITLDGTVVVSDSLFVPPNKRDIGMVFQSYAVWPHLSVFENVAFPLRVRKNRMPKSEIARRVGDALELVGLGGLDKRKPSQMSGGQQQRLSLARAIVHEPRCLLFDEPLSNLDAKLRERMRAELASIQRTLGFTALYVTHDQAEALSLSDEIAVMHQGQIVQQGPPREIYFHPSSQRVAEFVGSTNVVPGRLLESAGSAPRVEASVGVLVCAPTRGWSPAAGSQVLVGIRPEDIELVGADAAGGADLNVLEGEVTAVAFGGPATEVTVDLRSHGSIRVQTRSRVDVQTGERIRMGISPLACSVLPLQDVDRTAEQTAVEQAVA
jgi:iron(III) transport system ATP-binding protein